MSGKDVKARLLVIDDDMDIQELLKDYFKPRGFHLDCHSDPLEALKRLEKDPDQYDLILTDLKMPNIDGIEFVRRAKKISVEKPVILMTSHGTIETAVQAIQNGAYDFVVKPFNCAQLNLSIERGLRLRDLERENEVLRRGVRSHWSFEGAIGKSIAIKSVFDLAKRVANSTASILITGESGTGKEVIARAIHFHGNRRKSPFVAINCSAIPNNLLESELFGHAKGSFTGANDKRVGLFEEAEGGVLFLDEIGDMDLSLQTKLLRVLQERKIKRIGENQDRPIDVRVIAATHKDLRSEIQKKRFREDLFYRLCVIPFHIPPLRQRKDDIMPLAQHFFEKFKAQNNSAVKGFSKSALEHMMSLPWRGNVRELENAVEKAVVLCETEMIEVVDLPRNEAPSLETSNDAVFDKLVGVSEELPSLEEFSQRYVEFVLNSVVGTRERAARILKIDRKTLYRRFQSLQLAKMNKENQVIGMTTPSSADTSPPMSH